MQPGQLSHIAKPHYRQSQAASHRLILPQRSRAGLDQLSQVNLRFPLDRSDAELTSRYPPSCLSSRSPPIKNTLDLATTLFRNG